jgi:hypothetical protein
MVKNVHIKSTISKSKDRLYRCAFSFNYVLCFVESWKAKKLFPASLTGPSQQSSGKDLPFPVFPWRLTANHCLHLPFHGGWLYEGRWRKRGQQHRQREQTKLWDDCHTLYSWQTSTPCGPVANCLLDFDQECLEHCSWVRVVLKVHGSIEQPFLSRKLAPSAAVPAPLGGWLLSCASCTSRLLLICASGIVAACWNAPVLQVAGCWPAQVVCS